jgi:hypothetical protein
MANVKACNFMIMLLAVVLLEVLDRTLQMPDYESEQWGLQEGLGFCGSVLGALFASSVPIREARKAPSSDSDGK